MRVFIAGGHGRVAIMLGKVLVEQGHVPVGLIREPDQRKDLEKVGIEPVVADLVQDDLEPFLQSVNAIVFAAAGHSGQEQQVDHHGVAKLVKAAIAAGVERYLLLSALGAHAPMSWGQTYRTYLQAKADGEAAVQSSKLDWTIVRPGSLTDEPAKGKVTLSTQAGGYGQIPRADVAQVLAAILTAPNTIHQIYELYSGNLPIEAAIRSACSILSRRKL
jgi:uncharacterized protein YbjT (DUF2867 family)